MITRASRYLREDAYPTRRGDEDRDAGAAGSSDGGEGPGVLGVLPHRAGELVVRRLHRVVSSERLDAIADRYYGDPLKYWLLCDASDAIFPDELERPGRVLRVPRNKI